MDMWSNSLMDARTGDEFLYDMLFYPQYEVHYVEGRQFGGVVLPLLKLNRFDVYVYGYGYNISSLLLYIQQYGIEVKGIIDQDIEKTKIKRYDEVPIIHVSQISQFPSPDNVYVVIGVHHTAGFNLQEIVEKLHGVGITKYCTIDSREREIIDTRFSGEMNDYFQMHYQELQKLYETLEDKMSKQVMLEYIYSLTHGGYRYRLPMCEGKSKYFIGATVNGDTEPLYVHKKDEVWLNCGANIGDTIFQYLVNGFDADTIFAVEADEVCFEKLNGNLGRLPDVYQKKIVPVKCFIDANVDFETIFMGKTISLINADIEGNELDLLKALKKIIVRDRPVLAICAYHKRSDLIDLPEYLSSVVKDYSFVIRKYAGWTKAFCDCCELVLYAIPFERKI